MIFECLVPLSIYILYVYAVTKQPLCAVAVQRIVPIILIVFMVGTFSLRLEMLDFP